MTSEKPEKEDLFDKLKKAISEDNQFKLAQLLPLCNLKLKRRCFHCAVYSGKKTIVEYLAKSGINFNARYWKSVGGEAGASTPFIDAIRADYFDIAEYMLKHGARLDFSNITAPVVYHDMLSACDLSWKMRLTNNGELLNVVPKKIIKDWLFYSIEDGDLAMCQFLIEHQASPNELSYRNESPLQAAIRLQHYDIALWLLDFQPNLEIKDDKGRSLLHDICTHYGMVSRFYKKDYRYTFRYILSEWIKDKYSDLAQKWMFRPHTADSKTIVRKYLHAHDELMFIFFAGARNPCQKQKVMLVNAILGSTDLLEEVSLDGSTPLHYAADAGMIDMMALLIQHGANINARDINGRTPLFFANDIGHIANSNPEIGIWDFEGNTAFDYKLKTGNIDSAIQMVDYFKKPPIKSKNITDYFVANIINDKFSYGKNNHKLFEHIISHPHFNPHHRENGKHLLHFIADKWLILDKKHGLRINDIKDIIELYTLNGYDIGALDASGQNIFHRLFFKLLESWDYSCFIKLIKPEHLNTQDCHGQTPIHQLLKNIDIPDTSLDKILLMNYDRAIKDNEGETYLHHYIYWANHDPEQASFYIKLFVDGGLIINEKNSVGATPLHYACHFRKYGIAKALIYAGADVHLTSEDSRCAIHLSAVECDIDWMKYLFERGASAECKTNSQMYPIDFLLRASGHKLCRNGKNEDAEEIVGLLMPKNYNINEKCPITGATIFLKAIKNTTDAIVMSLFKYNPDIFAKDDFGLDALAYSVLYSRPKTFQKLLSMGASLKNSSYPNGETLLHFCAFETSNTYQSLDTKIIFECLMENGFDPVQNNNEGLSPLAFAFYTNNEVLCNYFIDKGYDINPKIENDTDIHRHGVLSHTYDDTNCIAYITRSIRFNTPDLLSYIAANSNIHIFVGYVKKAEQDLFFDSLLIDDSDLLPKVPNKPDYAEIVLAMIDKNKQEQAFSAEHYAAYYGRTYNLKMLQKLAKSRHNNKTDSPNCIYKYFLRYS